MTNVKEQSVLCLTPVSTVSLRVLHSTGFLVLQKPHSNLMRNLNLPPLAKKQDVHHIQNLAQTRACILAVYAPPSRAALRHAECILPRHNLRAGGH